MRVAEFDYALPEQLIAQHPAAERTRSRVLHLDGRTGALEDLLFTDLPRMLGPCDVLVLNDTRVIKARLTGRKSSGGRVELFVERLLGEREVLALIRASHPPRQGSELLVGDGVRAEVLGREEDLYRLRFTEGNAAELLERCGRIPLPPYITHAPDEKDAERYQTVYAYRPGAVAAPTAGLQIGRASCRERV